MEIYTIGFTQTTAEHFFGRLKAAGVQRQLSELSGIQQADIECGETQPTTVTAKRLADALGADFGFYETDTTGKTVPVEPASVKAA